MSSTISIKLSNASTERSKNLRLPKATLSSTTVYAAIYESPSVQASNVTEFPADVQAQLDSSELELQLVLQDVTSMEQLAVLNSEDMKSTSMAQLLEGALAVAGSETLKLSLQAAKADPSAPRLASIIGSSSAEAIPVEAASPAPRPQMAASGGVVSSMRGSKKLKVSNFFTGRSKNVRVLPGFSSSSAYDWLYEHEGIQTAKLLEFPAAHQTALDEKTQEIQLTLSASNGSNEIVFSAKQLRELTLEQILSRYPSTDETHMSIQAVDVKEEEAEAPTQENVPPPSDLRAMKSNTVGGSVRLKVTNALTQKSKNVRVMVATAYSASTYDWLYNHDGLQSAQILEFPDEQQSGLDQNTQELEIAVSEGGTEKVYSAKELRTKPLMEIVEDFPNYDSALIAITLQVVPAKDEEPVTEDGIEVSRPTGAAKRRISSANHGGSLRLKVNNTHTGMSKNVRVMPSTFSASTSGYDWLHGHDGLQMAKVLDFPEHQEAMDQKKQEIQVTIKAGGIDDKVYSAEELHFQTMPQILDPIFEKLPNPDNATITMSLEVVDVKATEEVEEVEEEVSKEVKEEEMSEEAKEAARLKKKEEEAAFWAAEEAKMLAQAEERKRQKEAKLQAALKAEKEALEAAQRQAAEKEAAIKAEEEERLAKREAQKQAALQAEQEARKQIEEDRQLTEELENLDKQREVQELHSKRKRTSLITQQLSVRASSAFTGGALGPFDDDDEKSQDDELLMDEEDKKLSKFESDAILEEEEDKRLDIMESQSLDDEILVGDEDKELGAFESNALLAAEEEDELLAMDIAVSVAAMTTSNRTDQPSDDEQMEDLLAEEEERELENQIEAEEIERSRRQDSALLAVEETEELQRMEEEKRLEEQQKEADVASATRGIMDEEMLPRDIAPTMDVGKDDNDGDHEQEESPDTALDQFERLLENEDKRENERMLALERKAAELEQGTAPEPIDESPRDRSVKVETIPKKKKGGVEARLRKAEQNFVADPARKRSPEVIPLSVEFNEFLRKLRKTVKQVKVYQAARQEAEASRRKMVEDFASLSENTPLYDLVGKKANLSEIEDIDARKAAEAAKSQRVRSYKSVDQLVELQGKVSLEEYQEEIVKYVEAWDETVSTRVNKAMTLHKKLEQDVLHYENKVAKLRTQAHDLEAKGKLLSSKQSARLNRNEMKLNDAWQIHEIECSSICNLLEEITNQGWHDLYPVVKSTAEWELLRMEREISTYGLGLPGILKSLGSTVNDVPIPEKKHLIRKEIVEQRNANRDLVRKINKLQAILKGTWTTKSEFQKVMQEKNVVL